MNIKIEVRVSEIDNGFLIDYWNGQHHKVYCSTMDEVVIATQAAFATKVVDSNAQAQQSLNSTITQVSTQSDSNNQLSAGTVI